MTKIKFHITSAFFFIQLWLLNGHAVSYPTMHYLQADNLASDSTQTDSLKNKPYTPSFRPTYRQRDRFGDPFSNNLSPSPLLLQDPATLTLDLEIDTAMNYTIYEKIGALNYRPTSTMSFEEFNRYQDRKMMKDYWQNRSSGLDGESAVSGRRLIPKLYISPIFDRIFGGSYVDIQPNGFVNLDFGGRWQKIENPAIPVNQQTNGGFNYNQQISMNVIGKVGEKLAISANFDNNNSFDFQNNMKIEYTGYAEDIIKKIEIGNVSMPVSNSLMRGGQSLFGIKTQLQFGKLFVTGVASRQQGSVQTRTFEGGGAEGTPFTLRASDYDEFRHFFLAHFFRDNYEKWLANIPQVNSGINIIRVEVYIVNNNNETASVRNFVALTDIGETDRLYNTDNINILQPGPADNVANDLFDAIKGEPAIRDIETVGTYLEGNFGMQETFDFEIRPTARKLEPREYRWNKKLGYISLQRRLQTDEVLAVSYEYTFNGQRHVVGELSEDYQFREDNELILLKMLKPASNKPNVPIWDLAMKNIYNLNAARLNQEGFDMRINYRDDINNYDAPNLNEGRNTNNVPIIELLKMDQLNVNNDRQKDGKMDYIRDVTVDENYGNIIFPVLEPFGATLEEAFADDEQRLKDKYVFDTLYRIRQNQAELIASKNKFFLNGKYSGSSGGSYNLRAFNIARGSVVVTAGGQILTEGIDYNVDYNAGGTVTITNQGQLNSGKQINISYEVDDLFSFQSRWLTGARFDYRFSDNINIGATVLHLNERPGGITRYSVGNEPTKNTKYGFDVNYQKESRWLTKMVDALPLINTKELSNVNFSGEFAQLIPGTSNKVDGEGLSYIDDFESAITPFNLGGGHIPWKLATTPSNPDEGFDLSASGPLGIGYKRAKLAWYIVDRTFYTLGGNKPSNISDDDLANNYVKSVFPQYIFTQRDAQVINVNLPVFDLAYYPNERGPYNYQPDLTVDGLLKEPETNFGAITRANTFEVDFTKSNMEYIEFWLMDPFIAGENGRVIDGIFNQNNTTGGELIFNLGDISEDVHQDNGRHEFENGLPIDGGLDNTEFTAWGKRTSLEFLTRFFDNSSSARPNQDIGLDGLNSAEESDYFETHYGSSLDNLNASGEARVLNDISGDDFEYFLSENYDNQNAKILERYKAFNGYENNSPVSTGGSFTASSTNFPENEDLNEDNYINTVESYFEYRLSLRPGNLNVGQSFIVDKVTDPQEADWFLFRIPISSPSKLIGSPSFDNIRFFRLYMTGWRQPVVLRMAKFQMVASQWRKYAENLADKGFDLIPESGTSDFDVSVVNIEENNRPADGKPPYVLPPGINRDLDNTTAITRRNNEQSLKICVEDLEDRDARAVYKGHTLDLVNYGRVKMFFHAEKHTDDNLSDGEVSAFLRFGLDFVENYYEIEVPLVITPDNLTSTGDELRREVWPEENEINLALEELLALKSTRNRAGIDPLVEYTSPSQDGKYQLTIVGNPKLNNIVQLMLGVRNLKSDDIEPKSICIWANELRVTDFDTEKGWAANARISAKLADFATINASTRYTSIGYGSIQQRISERTRDEQVQYDVSANINVDKLIPWETGIKIPMFVSYEKQKSMPKFDPLDPDITLDASVLSLPEEERNDYREKVIDQTIRKSINFINVRKEKVKADAISHIYDIENFAFSYSYSEIKTSNVQTEEYLIKNYGGGVTYNYNPQPLSIEPFKNTDKLSSPYLRLIKDINFSPLPNSFSVRATMDRSFTKRQLRNVDLTTEGIDPYFEKYFTFNRSYNLRWNIFKSVSLNYNANANAIIDEPEGDINTQAERDSIWANVKRLGRMKNYDQSIGLTYRLPLDKLPLTDWMSADYRYNVNYKWLSASFDQIEEFGNIIDNSRTQDMTGKIDLVRLYNKSSYLKSINTPRRSSRSSGRPTRSAPVDTTSNASGGKAFKGLLRLIMSVRSINVTFGKRESTALAGFLPKPSLFGLDRDFSAPGWGFVFGSQDADIRFEAAESGWLVRNPTLTTPFLQSQTENLDIRAAIEPFRDLKIQVDMKRQVTNGYQEIYRYDSLLNDFVSLTPSRSGSYSVTFLPIVTTFSKDDADFTSEVFTTFEENRSVIRNRLNAINTSGEYNINSQDVLVPAFIAAYTDRNPATIALTPFPKTPLPNWRVDYAGLSKIPKLKELFASINITHAYSATFSISNFVNSLLYDQNLDLSNSFLDYPLATVPGDNGLIPVYQISQIDIVERFSPLIGVNIRTKNRMTIKVEYKKERNLSLNLSNAQVTELTSSDFSFDFGLTKDKFKIPFKIKGSTVVLENDLQFRIGFTVRDTKTIQRKIDDVNTITNGNINYQIRPTMSYVANQKLNITMYFERNINQPKVSNSFNRATTAFGIQVRFSLSQ